MAAQSRGHATRPRREKHSLPLVHERTTRTSSTGYYADMLILVDEEIPGGRETFAAFGEVRTFAGRTLTAADAAGAEVLIVRSVTRVDARLLSGSRVRFVGTVTSGADHVDTAWLAANGIAFASAAGGNAGAVAEYVLAAVLLLAERLDFDPTGLTLGVVGSGRIGSRVARWGRLLGMRVLLCDPPLQRQTGSPEFLPAAEVLHNADIVTLHVPLTNDGPDPTADLVDAAWLGTLKDGSIFINTSRGEVVREDHLSAAMPLGRLRAVVLDVWRNEPDVDAGLVQRATIATPHVAGYSVEARQRAVQMIREALSGFIAPAAASSKPWQKGTGTSRQALVDRAKRARLGASPLWPRAASDSGLTLPPRASAPSEGRGSLRVGAENWWREAAAPILRACDVAAMDAEFRDALLRRPGSAAFDELRRRYASRREFSSLVIPSDIAPVASDFLRAIGFGQ